MSFASRFAGCIKKDDAELKFELIVCKYRGVEIPKRKEPEKEK